MEEMNYKNGTGGFRPMEGSIHSFQVRQSKKRHVVNPEFEIRKSQLRAKSRVGGQFAVEYKEKWKIYLRKARELEGGLL